MIGGPGLAARHPPMEPRAASWTLKAPIRDQNHRNPVRSRNFLRATRVAPRRQGPDKDHAIKSVGTRVQQSTNSFAARTLRMIFTMFPLSLIRPVTKAWIGSSFP